MLKYEKGQLCKAHTDYALYRVDGPRLATFLYI